MPEYVRVANGYVNGSLTSEEQVEIFAKLKRLNKQIASEFDISLKGYSAIELMPLAVKLIGPSFSGFVKANFNEGRSTLSNLMRSIVLYLNGECGHQSLLSVITIEENRFKFKDDDTVDVITAPAFVKLPLIKEGQQLNDYDFFRLMAGIGPGHVGRLLLLLGGDAVYD